MQTEAGDVLMGQPRWQSWLEAIVNVLIGYGVALLSQVAIFPLFGIYVPFSTNMAIGAAFTVISIVRSYLVRRGFNRWHEFQCRRALSATGEDETAPATGDG